MKKNTKITAALGALLLALTFAVTANAATVQRSNFLVGNLSCTSCLATIEAELKGVPGALGMDADLRAGRVTVDHLSSLAYEQIGAAITKLGYPATLDWSATLPEQYAQKFSRQGRYNGGCGSSGCGVAGGAGAGPTGWKAAPGDGTISRTTLQVANLTCTSCLASIAAELRQMPETYGMQGYLSRGVVIVDHETDFDNSRIAAAIADLGYPARILALNVIPAAKAFSAGPDGNTAGPPSRIGSGSSNGPCNATAASWQKLYKRYFSQTDSK